MPGPQQLREPGGRRRPSSASKFERATTRLLGREVTVHPCEGCLDMNPPDVLSWRIGEAVDALEPGMGGLWLVTTQGSEHIWDLDKMTYRRIPGAAQFAGDDETHAVTRVSLWPRVGQVFLVWYDDPEDPSRLDQFRRSSIVRTIERLEEHYH